MFPDGFDAVGFDLDGTLIDTAPDLATAANAMLHALGGRQLPVEQIRRLIGAGIDQFVAGVLAEGDAIGAHDGRLQESAAALFRDLYRQGICVRSRVYPGVRQTLQALGRLRIPFCCITNEESGFAHDLLHATGLQDAFAMILCADRAEDRKPSPNLLLTACAHFRIAPARMLYVGDAATDVAAARRAGCSAVAVDYGYDTASLLARARPDRIIARLDRILGPRAVVDAARVAEEVPNGLLRGAAGDKAIS